MSIYSNVQLYGVDSLNFADTRRYWCLIRKLIYLVAIGVVCQSMESPKQVHWDVVCCILRYPKWTVGMNILYKKSLNLTLSLI